MSQTAVELHGLLTGYQGRDGSVKVSGPLDACLNKGEMTCLLGPNGAGKSTLLKTLSGMLSPLSGSVTVDGKSLSDYSVSELAKVIGLVLTEKPAVGNMKVEQLVAMGRSPYTGFWGRLSDDDRKIVDDAVGLVGIGPLCGRPVASLSDGERQKVMIAKALAQQTPVIFLDEPTAFLDFPSKVEIMRLLRSLHDSDRPLCLFQLTIWRLLFRLPTACGCSTSIMALKREHPADLPLTAVWGCILTVKESAMILSAGISAY